SGSGDNLIYKNIATSTLLDQKEIEDKMFLVKDKLQKVNWKLGDQNKKIGEYSVRNATALMDGETVTAWFTADIPVNNGPGEFWGLPGLILSVDMPDGTKITCEEITIKSGVTIEVPKKGKEVSPEEYADLEAQYIENIKSQYGSGSGSTVIRN
ncbi:MAG: GLPGLI family protein, partial [Cyclobacteriaceae bacterium]